MECNVYKSVKHVGLSEKKIKEVVFFCLKKLNKTHASISVHLVGKQKIKTLNNLYRNQDEITDVLSFSTEQELREVEEDLGDIFICIPQIKKQAKEFKVSYTEELIRMLVHGILHLAGYDHQVTAQSSKMFSLQEKIVDKLLNAG